MKRFPSRLALTLSFVVCCTALNNTAATATAGVFSFGSNFSGKTGLGTTSGTTTVATPIVTTNLVGHSITQVSAGEGHSLLLAADGTAFSFGANNVGRTGLGISASGSYTTVATPIVTTNLGGRKITQVATGDFQSLFLAEDGTVFSCGLNNGTTLGMTTIATPIDTTNLGSRKITQVAAGDRFSLLLAGDGSVFSFGANDGGQTGLGISSGTTTTVATPIDTMNLGGRKIIQVSAGGDGSLVLAEDGRVFGFGSNAAGQLGLGVGSPSSVSVATPIDNSNLGSRKIVQVAAGQSHSLLLADDGSVFSFGQNALGQTGLGTSSGNALIATPIVTTNLGSRKITEVAAGLWRSLLLADDGSVFSFGDNTVGGTGQGTTSGYTLVATPIDATNLSGLRVTHVDVDSHGLLLTAPDLPGDFNNDGSVDAADYVAWRKTGINGPTGYDAWRANFGQPSGSGSVANANVTVPEPTTLMILILATVGMPLRRRCIPSECRKLNSA